MQINNSLGVTGALTGVDVNLSGTLTGAGGSFTSLTVGGNTVFHAGNDGAGSGLDADTVDGIQASGFLQNTGNQTLTNGNLTLSTTINPFIYLNDSSTSTFIRNATGKMYLGSDDGEFRLIQQGGVGTFVTVSPGTFTYNGGAVWHAGNDGAGSGLDADTVDGVQASNLLQLNAGFSWQGASAIFDWTGATGMTMRREGGIDSNTAIRFMGSTWSRYVGMDVNGDFSVSTSSNLDAGDVFKVDMDANEAYIGGNNRVYHGGNITYGTAAPSGGVNGDIYLQYS